MSESNSALLQYHARIRAFLDLQLRLQRGETIDDGCHAQLEHIYEIDNQDLRLAVVRAGFRIGVDPLRMRRLFFRINDRLWDFLLFPPDGQSFKKQDEDAFWEAFMDLQQDLEPLLDLLACLPESDEIPKPAGSVRARFLDFLMKNPDKLGWSQRRIADAIGCSPGAISKYSTLLERLRAEERERRRPRSSKAE